MPTELLFIVPLVGLVVGLYWIVLRVSSQKIAIQYRQLSKDLGLELNELPSMMAGFIRPDPSLYGQYNGREVSVSVPGKGMQNTRQIETVLKVELKDKDFALQIAPSGLLGGFRQRDGRGLEKWYSDDPIFGGAFDLRVKDSQNMQSILFPALRERMCATLKEGKANVYIGSGVMAYAELGLLSAEQTRRRFQVMTQILCDLAETIEKA